MSKKFSIRRFSRDSRGNMAMMTALMMGVVMLGTGAALDYTMMANKSGDLQNVADAAVLAAARSGEDDIAKLQKIAEEVVKAHNLGQELKVTARYDDDHIVVDIASEYTPVMTGMFGDDGRKMSVQAASPLPTATPINLALVLDTTGSMEGANMNALKQAASALLTEMEDAESETRVSIVPFGQYVNIGYKDAKTDTRTWIDRGNEGVTKTHCWDQNKQVSKPTCKKVGKIKQAIWRDGKFRGYKWKDQWKCTGGKWEKERVCKKRTPQWHGCMGTRANDSWAKKAEFGGVKLPAALDEKCGTEVMPLSQNFGEMRKRVQSLTTSGTTYLPGGLAWGWRTLNKEIPYTEASSTKDPNLMTAMLFMTDGGNNRSRGDSSSNASGTKHEYSRDGGSSGLKLTKELCQAIKDDGIQVFVVAYQLPGATSTVSVLSECATDQQSFFEPDNAQELIDTFTDIAKLLNKTRLAY